MPWSGGFVHCVCGGGDREISVNNKFGIEVLCKIFYSHVDIPKHSFTLKLDYQLDNIWVSFTE